MRAITSLTITGFREILILSEYFTRPGLNCSNKSFEVDTRALRVLEREFELAPEFRDLGFEELCRCELRFLGRPDHKQGAPGVDGT